MRILFFVSSLEGGGAERVATLLCNHWAERGDEVTIMATFSGRGGCVFELSPRVTPVYLADIVSNSTNKLLRLSALRKFVKAHKPDVIISFLSNVNIAVLVATVTLDIPVIASERAQPWLGAMRLGLPGRILQKLSYNRAKLLVAQTTGASRWTERNWRNVPCKIIPNPIVYPLVDNAPVLKPEFVVSERSSVVLAVARLAPQKRLDVLIDAFAKTAGEGWELVILGEGGSRSALEAQVKKAKVDGRIHMPGFAGNLADWYQRASIFVLTSTYEGFPNSLLEAMAYGVPSISFDIEFGPRDIMKNGERGVLIPDNDHVPRLASALNRLIQDGSYSESVSARCIEVREEYSMKVVSALWDESFRLVRGGK